MAKVTSETIKQAYDRLAAAKSAAYKARVAFEATEEYKTSQLADHELEQAEDVLAGVNALLNGKVI